MIDPTTYKQLKNLSIIPCCGYREKCFEPGHNEWGHLGGTMCKFLQDSGDELTFICSKINKPIHKNEIY